MSVVMNTARETSDPRPHSLFDQDGPSRIELMRRLLTPDAPKPDSQGRLIRAVKRMFRK